MPKLFDIDIDAVTMRDAVSTVRGWVQSANENSADAECRYVVTPNVDHAVMYGKREDLRDAYKNASLVLADGAPLVLASRLFGRVVPERVAGSDLVPALFSAASEAYDKRSGNQQSSDEESVSNKPLTIFLLGAAPGVAQLAADAIHKRWSGVEVVGLYSPPLGFENDDEENANILKLIENANPDILIVGLGAPKQELWVAKHQERISARAALCVGATIDFLAGHRRRAPMWMRKIGLEWCHRVLTEPRRLAKRYFYDALALPGLFWRQWRSARTA